MICPICQDKKLHSIKLPCGHSFCYLCIKGVYARQRHCPMCRQPIPVDTITNPSSELNDKLSTENGLPCWMYQAKSGGWWLYEERVSNELEKSYQAGTSDVQIQISGFMYIVDFIEMIQFREEKPERIRHIKREIITSNEDSLRGVAGIPLSLTSNRTEPAGGDSKPNL